MNRIEIVDLSDPRLEVFTKLTEHQLRNVLDPARALMIVESEIAMRVALEHGIEPVALLLDQKHVEKMSDLLEDLPEETPVFVASHELASELVGYRVHRGIFCACKRPKPSSASDLLARAKRVAVLEGIVDTTNVGAIFRSAAALGADAVLLAPNCADPLSRRSIRVSMGNVFLVPWARFEAPWPKSAFEQLAQAQFHTAALALSSEARTLDDPTLKQHERLALFFGTEGDGLSQHALSGCDDVVYIPMSHGVDSLNVAAASAVAFWELFRS